MTRDRSHTLSKLGHRVTVPLASLGLVLGVVAQVLAGPSITAVADPDRPLPAVIETPTTKPAAVTTTQPEPTPDTDTESRVKGSVHAVKGSIEQRTPVEPTVPAPTEPVADPTPPSELDPEASTVTAAPPATVPAPPPAGRCTISYRADGIGDDVLRNAFTAVSSQLPIDFVAQADAMVHIRAYWPADNPTAAFGWTGDVGGQLSIYIKPLALNAPDFAAKMLVHELGHVVGLDHTTTGTPMDDFPATSTFTQAQLDAAVLPC